MQNMAQPAPSKGNSAQSVVVTAFLLFALAGGIMGFAVGTFTHHTQSQPPSQTSTSANPNSNKTATPVAQLSPTTTPVVSPQPLDYPNALQGLPNTNGVYTYTLTAISKATKQPVTADGITCHLALIKGKPQINGTPLLLGKDGAPMQIDTLQTNEIPTNQGLIYQNTPQTQPCKNGVGTWTFTVNPSLAPGTYYTVGITDWAGIYYNWSYAYIIIPKK